MQNQIKLNTHPIRLLLYLTILTSFISCRTFRNSKSKSEPFLIISQRDDSFIDTSSWILDTIKIEYYLHNPHSLTHYDTTLPFYWPYDKVSMYLHLNDSLQYLNIYVTYPSGDVVFSTISEFNNLFYINIKRQCSSLTGNFCQYESSSFYHTKSVKWYWPLP